jgi:hypothetical protein
MTNRETEEKIRKLASLDPRGAASSWLFYLSGEGEERELADDLLDVLLHQKLKKDYQKQIFLEPAPASDCFGEYALGSVLYPSGKFFSQFGLREAEWIKHVLITGMTGAGKTNLAFQILKEFKRHNKPFMVFDWKRNYRDLLQLPEFQQLRVFSVGRDLMPFRFNPLIPPPGTEPGHWLMKLVDVLKHAYFVGEGVEFLLREGTDHVYEQCGFFDGSKAKVPTFEQVRTWVFQQRLQGRMSLWKASALRVLESLCFRHGLGQVVLTERDWDYTQLLNSDVVLELDSLSDSDKVFLMEALILWLYEFRKNEGKRETFKHALLIEEGHHILSHKKENVEGAETIMETCLRQIREFGEAAIVIDQEPTKLSNSIKANTYCKISFALGNGKDALEIANCMGLNKEESEYLNLLEVGHAIVSLKGRVFTPLYVAFPRVAVRKGAIGDEELRNQALAARRAS